MRVKQAPPELIAKALREFQRREIEERERKARYGEILPIVNVWAFGTRLVGVGSNIYQFDPEKGFPNFLSHYLVEKLGVDWLAKEQHKPEAEQHPAVRWRTLGLTYMHKHQKEDGICSAPPNGAFAAYMTIVYDMYVIESNGLLDDMLLKRLRHREHFHRVEMDLLKFVLGMAATVVAAYVTSSRLLAQKQLVAATRHA